MLSFRQQLALSRARQITRLERGALRKTPGMRPRVWLKARGKAQMAALEARGWELKSQDTSMTGWLMPTYLMSIDQTQLRIQLELGDAPSSWA